MKIQRLVFPEKHRCEVESADLDERLKPGEILVRNKVSLVSAGTELAMFTRTHRGFDEPGFTYAKYPFKPGYSAVGEVVESAAALPAGTLVYYPGPHATYFKGNADGAMPVPANMNPERATFLNLLRVAMTAPRLAPARIGDQVLVIGLGLVGNLCAQLYALTGARDVAGADLSSTRVRKAQDCGLRLAFDVGRKPLAEWVSESMGTHGPALVIEAIGSARAISDGLKVVAKRGAVILLGSPRAKMEIDPYFDLHSRGVSLIGAHAGSVDAAVRKQDEPMLTEWLRTGRVQVEPLITQRMPFVEALAAYEGLRDKPDEYLGVLLNYGA